MPVLLQACLLWLPDATAADAWLIYGIIEWNLKTRPALAILHPPLDDSI